MSRPEIFKRKPKRVIEDKWVPAGITRQADYRHRYIKLKHGFPARFDINTGYLNQLKKDLELSGEIVIARKTSETIDPHDSLPPSGKFSDSISNSSGAGAAAITDFGFDEKLDQEKKKRFGLNAFRSEKADQKAIAQRLISIDFDKIRDKKRSNKTISEEKMVEHEILKAFRKLALRETRPSYSEVGHIFYLMLSIIETYEHYANIPMPGFLGMEAKVPSETAVVESWGIYIFLFVVSALLGYPTDRYRPKDDMPNEALKIMKEYGGSDPTHVDQNYSKLHDIFFMLFPIIIYEDLKRAKNAIQMTLKSPNFVRQSRGSIWSVQPSETGDVPPPPQA